MSLTARERSGLETWAKSAVPKADVFYRSVSYTYMDPPTVLDGKGAKEHGGRFAAVGTRAVYLSESDSVASGEVTARKARLGGSSQITTSKYPRIVFRVSFDLKRVLDFSEDHCPADLKALRERCLDVDDLSVSQEVGDALQKHGIEGLLFPSETGKGLNLIVFMSNCAESALHIENEDELVNEMAQIAAKRK